MAMVRLTDIVEKVRSYHPAADVDLINKAYVYSAKAHDGQMRKSGDPYFIHPVSVAHIIADMRLDPASVCAALLHDVVEDTAATNEEIKKREIQVVAWVYVILIMAWVLGIAFFNVFCYFIHFYIVNNFKTRSFTTTRFPRNEKSFI